MMLVQNILMVDNALQLFTHQWLHQTLSSHDKYFTLFHVEFILMQLLSVQILYSGVM